MFGKSKENFYMARYLKLPLKEKEEENVTETKHFDDLEDAVKFFSKSQKKIAIDSVKIAKFIKDDQGGKVIEVFDAEGKSIKKID